MYLSIHKNILWLFACPRIRLPLGLINRCESPTNRYNPPITNYNSTFLPTRPPIHFIHSNISWKIERAFSIIDSDNVVVQAISNGYRFTFRVSNTLFSVFHPRRTLHLRADDELSYYTKNVLLEVYFEPQILCDDIVSLPETEKGEFNVTCDVLSHPVLR